MLGKYKKCSSEQRMAYHSATKTQELQICWDTITDL